MHTRIGDEMRAKVRAAWPALLGAVASGANIGAACAAAGIKREHAYAYQLENADARKEWEYARELSADAYADQVADIAENAGDNPQVARVQLDALRWLAAKRNPRIYSDKATLDVNVRTVDLTRIINAANARLAAARNPTLAERKAAAIDAEIIPTALVGYSSAVNELL